jgi:tetratricopeptide (TPR) repeat protein
MKAILCLSFLLGATALLPAQQTATNRDQSLPPALRKKEQAFADSDAHFRAHNYKEAEAILFAANQAASGTPQWHHESGAALMRVAFGFHAQADANTATDVARHALAHLQQADQAYDSNADPAEVANENELMGFLFENLLGDRAAAKRCYQKAVKLSPQTGHAAELLDTILRTEAEELSKKNYIPGH